MKRSNNATIKKSNQRTTIISPLLSLVVATLMSAPIVHANAELIIHSEPKQASQSNQNQQVATPVKMLLTIPPISKIIINKHRPMFLSLSLCR